MELVRDRMAGVEARIVQLVMGNGVQLAGMRKYMGWFGVDAGPGLWLSAWPLDRAERAVAWLERRARQRILTWQDVAEGLKDRGGMVTLWMPAAVVEQLAGRAGPEYEAWRDRMAVVRRCRPGKDLYTCREYVVNGEGDCLYASTVRPEDGADIAARYPEGTAVPMPSVRPAQPVLDAAAAGNSAAAGFLRFVRGAPPVDPSAPVPDELRQWASRMLGPTKHLPCDVCRAPATGRCGGCLLVRYCSAACQAQAWPAHRPMCPIAKTLGLVAREILHHDAK